MDPGRPQSQPQADVVGPLRHRKPPPPPAPAPPPRRWQTSPSYICLRPATPPLLDRECAAAPGQSADRYYALPPQPPCSWPPAPPPYVRQLLHRELTTERTAHPPREKRRENLRTAHCERSPQSATRSAVPTSAIRE